MPIVAVINQKGGVAKTTTTANLGAALAQRGERVLVVDLDPQANLTLGLQCDLASLPYGLHDVLLDPRSRPLAGILRPVAGLTMALAPGSVDVARAEAALSRREGPPFDLREALHDSRIQRTFSWVLLDCPPSLGVLTQNAVAAATHLLVPTEAKMYAFAGMATLSGMVQDMHDRFGTTVDLLGVVITMYEPRTNLHQTIAGEIRERFGDRLFQTVIHRNIRLSEAEVDGSPVICYDRRARGAREYLALAGEVQARIDCPEAREA